MHLIATIVVGLLAGLLARVVTPGKNPAGLFMTAALGVAGSIVATFTGQALHLYPADHAAGFVASVIGAVGLLLAYRFVGRRR
jgi:uncharacterized membrane protein YeaQ/YmgE (transglycosylase-associated protein family)